MKTEKEIRTLAKHYALGQFLSDWPSEWAYEEVLDYLRANTWIGDEDPVTLWEVVENHTGEQVAGFIEDMRDQFMCFATDLQEKTQ